MGDFNWVVVCAYCSSQLNLMRTWWLCFLQQIICLYSHYSFWVTILSIRCLIRDYGQCRIEVVLNWIATWWIRITLCCLDELWYFNNKFICKYGVGLLINCFRTQWSNFTILQQDVVWNPLLCVTDGLVLIFSQRDLQIDGKLLIHYYLWTVKLDL